MLLVTLAYIVWGFPEFPIMLDNGETLSNAFAKVVWKVIVLVSKSGLIWLFTLFKLKIPTFGVMLHVL